VKGEAALNFSDTPSARASGNIDEWMGHERERRGSKARRSPFEATWKQWGPYLSERQWGTVTAVLHAVRMGRAKPTSAMPCMTSTVSGGGMTLYPGFETGGR